MVRAEFFNVHKDYAQDGTNSPVFGHSEFLGLGREAAYAKYHELLSNAYTGTDPWVFIYIESDNGVFVDGNLIDRRVEPQQEGST